jgi:hypothetical protein
VERCGQAGEWWIADVDGKSDRRELVYDGKAIRKMEFAVL